MEDFKENNMENEMEMEIAPSPNINPFEKQLQLLAADFANYKKRMDKEQREWISRAQIEAVVKILPIIDEVFLLNKDVKLTAANTEGFALVQKNIAKVLQDLGVEKVPCDTFDPEWHSALTQIASPDHTSGQIIEIVKDGYKMHGKVVRHAQVIVAQ